MDCIVMRVLTVVLAGHQTVPVRRGDGDEPHNDNTAEHS